jgi:16S rRNA (cytosine1402-N4)-methyltransferase
MAEHVPVLLEECIEMLNIRPDGIYLDGTLGLGGHSAAIAARLSSDPAATSNSRESWPASAAETASGMWGR